MTYGRAAKIQLPAPRTDPPPPPTRARPTLQVRYGTFATSVEKQQWRDCVEAEVVDGGALAIKWDDDNLEWVPLHVIRGPIQVRAKPAPSSPSTSEERAQ